ncbi:MAG TPA: hypothetical protein VL371_14650 [Gemmataceae bacterium]|nr:hypothetical protein [Gemmataceae bacterium]
MPTRRFVRFPIDVLKEGCSFSYRTSEGSHGHRKRVDGERRPQMRLLSPTLGFAVVTICLCLPRICSAEFHPIFNRVWGNVVVATDMTPEGRKLTPPTPEHPVYYLGTSLGARFDTIPGDRLPDVKQMNLLVARVLAKQGYLYASPGVHDPSLFLVLQWAYLRIAPLWFVGYNPKYDHPIHPFEVDVMIDTAGPGSFEPHPCYGIIITAFDFKSARAKHPVVCWQTRITLPAIGKSMAQALPTMIIAAGPAIGHESNLPFLGDADAMPKGHVTVGDLEVVGYEDPPAPAGKAAEPNR